MEDLISRQAAIDALGDQLDYLHLLNKDDNPAAECEWYGVNWSRNTIAKLPSAGLQKTGKWIKHSIGGTAYLECSCCHYWFPEEYLCMDNFCSYCGAFMKGER